MKLMINIITIIKQRYKLNMSEVITIVSNVLD